MAISTLIGAAEAVGAVGIPGGWMVGGISNGCGKVREEGGGVAGAFHIRPASTARAGESCLHHPAAGSRREPRPDSRADLREPRAALRVAPAEPRADLRAAPREPDSEPPTPLPRLRMASLADGKTSGAERNLMIKTTAQPRLRLVR
jgi:hypothetical protein